MRRIVLSVVILTAISITMGTIIGASSEAKDPVGVSETMQFTGEAAPVVKTIQLTPNSAGNWRHPGVAEDSQGNRLVIFRDTSGTRYSYVYCPKGGTWSSPKQIAGGDQPPVDTSLYCDIKVDSTDRFHCYWESYPDYAVYTSFKNGVWTDVIEVTRAGTKYDKTGALALNSLDTAVVVDCNVGNQVKDIYVHSKTKSQSKFERPINITRDRISSTQPDMIFDGNDHPWVVWKNDLPLEDAPLEDNLVGYLAQFDKNFKDIGNWILLSTSPGWSFLPRIAINSEGKIMSIWAYPKGNQYMSRLYDPETKTLGPQVPLGIGLCRKPWHTFFSRLTAHGKDFYAAALDPGRVIMLVKFNVKTSQWDKVAQISNTSAEMLCLYSGYDQMLVAWSSWREPTNVYLTTVNVDPFIKIFIKSVSNLSVVKRTERTFFRGFTLNALTWTANPDNTEKNITITAQRIYRKARTADNSAWLRIAQVGGTVYKYEDRNIPADSDYVYAVTCVDDKEHESQIY